MADELTLSHRARVHLVNPARMADLHQTMHSRFLPEAREESFFYFDAEISNDLLDSHFTHMNEKTLRNYAQDASAGVAFLKGHNWREFPLGYSMEGTYEQVGDKKRTVASFYTARTVPEADDLIRRMEAHLLRDVSVGFHGGEMFCDICRQSFFECNHWPGFKYEVKNGDVVEKVVATFEIDGARLSEVSGVFDGSTPEAMILKAQRFAAQGLLDAKWVDALEQRYRVRLPVSKTFSVPRDMGNLDPIPKEVVKMEDKVVEQIRKALAVPLSEEYVRDLKEEDFPTAIEAVVKTMKGMESQASEGRQYRTDLIAAAHVEGVRAFGPDYDREGYDATLQSASLTTIKRFTADWKKVADASLPSGRKSQDAEERIEVETVNLTPDSAYR